MAGRKDARRCVLQMLYLADQNPDADIHWIRESFQDQLADDSLVDFAWAVFTGVREQRDAVDEQIKAVAEHWRIDRMVPTDRNVIRMGCYELHQIGAPAAVVLNECVELAKEFGTENSSSFVNGILDKIADSYSPATPHTDT